MGTVVIFEHPPALLAVQSIHASLNKWQESGHWIYLKCSRNMCIVRLYHSRSEEAALSGDIRDGLFIHSQDSSIPGLESHPTQRHFSEPKETSRL